MFFTRFRPPCWSSSRWAPSWRFHTKPYNFEWYILTNNSSMGHRTALKLGHIVYLLLTSTISQFVDFIYWMVDDFTFLIVTCMWLKTKNTASKQVTSSLVLDEVCSQYYHHLPRQAQVGEVITCFSNSNHCILVLLAQNQEERCENWKLCGVYCATVELANFP